MLLKTIVLNQPDCLQVVPSWRVSVDERSQPQLGAQECSGISPAMK